MSTVKDRSFLSTRPSDYLYDSNFILPTVKDYNKYALKATLASAQLAIAPVFANMFSDLKSCPRQTLIMKVGPKHDKFIGNKISGEQVLGTFAHVQVGGTDRAKFFKLPLITLSTDLEVNKIIREKQRIVKSAKVDKTHKNKGVQTVYRESSAQTTHWKTDNVIMDKNDLKLKFLDENLPPGMHEVDMINRARNRRAWETLLPDVEDAKTLEQQRLILEAISLDFWAFREDEIAHIQELRLEILERMLQEVLDNTAARTQGRLERITERLVQKHQVEMSKMKHITKRELRRLYRQNFGISTKYERVNIIDEHADYKSEVYAPLMRHGEHPKRGHAQLKLEHYDPMLYQIENYSTLPRWMFDENMLASNEIKLPGRRLCIRETKWTEPVLKQLHEELSYLHRATRVQCTLRERRKKPRLLEGTMVFAVPDDDHDVNEAILILQCIIRGRATQTLIYEGRDRCRELIEELQCTHFLDMNQYTDMRRKRMEVLGQQRNKQILWEREANLEMALNQLQGNVLGTMLDFLSKELVRIKDERRLHALALLYERERRDREAAEAGRRQAEERRRRENDEMFKQVVKVHQDSVDVYLQDIITEGISHASDVDAKYYVEKLAELVEEDTQRPPTEFLEKEELIADMICNFVIPGVEKTAIRNKVKKQQQKHLRCAHALIYDKLETLPKIKKVKHGACPDLSTEEMISQDSSLIKIHDYLEYVLDEQSGLLKCPEENINSFGECSVVHNSEVTETNSSEYSLKY